jgi:hypothetical protein
MRGHAEMHDATALVMQDDEHEQGAKVALGTTKKSADAKQPTWLRRNVRQVCDGDFGGRGMYLDTAAWLTLNPSLSSSPWIRGAPHSGCSRQIRRLRSQTSAGTGGRPRLRDRDFQVQKARKPVRCHRTTVSGRTTTTVWRQPVYRR